MFADECFVKLLNVFLIYSKGWRQCVMLVVVDEINDIHALWYGLLIMAVKYSRPE